MPEPTKLPRTFSYKTELPTGELPPPQGINFFHFTQAGLEVQLLVGYMDLREMFLARDTIVAGEHPTFHPQISNRFYMSLNGLITLKHKIDEVVTTLERAGVKIESATNPTTKK